MSIRGRDGTSFVNSRRAVPSLGRLLAIAVASLWLTTPLHAEDAVPSVEASAVAREPEVKASAVAPEVEASAVAQKPREKDTPWYERLKVRGYTQFRYNRLPSFNTNDNLTNPQGDRTIGGGNGFSIRRARLVISGDVHERISVYLQTDFASAINDQLNVAIMRDWYADIFLTKDKSLRLRVGQSKIPFGFENLQSSQNRVAFDRNDALNSAVKDERDIGIFAYWAPPAIRERFKYLVDSGLKGSGDYGVVGLGVYNGQSANRPALSDDMHVVGRVTYPFKFGEQFVEFGGGGYYGKYYVSKEADGPYSFADGGKMRDMRGFASVVVYPQPFGFMAEANYGVGPSLGERGDQDENVIKERKLFGGYAQAMLRFEDVLGTIAITPYARATYYEGGKKFEQNAPFYKIRQLELGVEWQVLKALELQVAYDLEDRTAPKAPFAQQRGHVTRVQLQINY